MFASTLCEGSSGLHAGLLQHGIESATISTTSSIVSSVAFGRGLGRVVRSLSNLDERLHQSFWFYMLPDNHTFVSIGICSCIYWYTHLYE